MNNPIAISLSPNTDKKDVQEAVRVMFSPWSWKDGSAIGKVESWFKHEYAAGASVSFNSGRSALYALLKSFEIKEGDEVILQAFTCVAVCDAILWCGVKPVFVDIDRTLNVDPTDLEKKITSETRAIIVQHTFGIPAQIKEISVIAKKHNLILIEDCAHCLGAAVENRKLGTFGDAAFFSFGRDKIVSSVFGGLAIIKPNFKTEIKNLKKMHEDLSFPSYGWIFQQIVHPIFFQSYCRCILSLLEKLFYLSC